ncbi:ABC transporter ATP-binding protein [Pseudomonas sp.]|jgi:ABC-2 type transport system ATP-binding protein|uniref:ABC transporter ATP-binding protein n=1 Tax=Pseudomonas sp. TaxID=306 RepID=UPI003FA7DF08
MAISVRGVSFHYGARVALDRVSFDIQKGKVNALLGPNGAGKSTLIALFSRLYSLQEGDILLDELSIRSQPRRALARLGVVFQQSTLDLDLSVQQNLSYHAALHGISRREAAPRIEQELERQGLMPRRHEQVRQLNGGHRRRVEIARALLHKPSVLLLDEASAGLDPVSRNALNEHVRKLCNERELTVVWTTHLMDEIRPEDPVVLLDRGRILAQDLAARIAQRAGSITLTEAFTQLTGSAPEAA